MEYARYANFAFSFGVTMAASLFLGYYGGNWLDTKLGTSPLLMVVGLLLGVAASFYSLFTELKMLQVTSKMTRQDRPEPPDKEN
ncbi:hypothetical protein SY88_11960 [Clostridiales bacterium PH28_bin88]|nr:hypothetical protein SY88_11960 [Clostridiales bacterium PH28_bin88]